MRIDLCFRVRGESIPLDDAYPLFSSLSDAIPELHADPSIGIHPIHGHAIDGRLRLTNRSQLILRIPEESRPGCEALSGKSFRVADATVQVQFWEAHRLIPRVSLFSPFVVIKGFQEPQTFHAAVGRKLAEMGIEAKTYLVRSPKPQHQYVRQVMRIHGRTIVGFAVEISELLAEDSIRIQEEGVGGRHHFGCGLFVPGR